MMIINKFGEKILIYQTQIIIYKYSIIFFFKFFYNLGIYRNLYLSLLL